VIPQTVLVVAEPFSAQLRATAVASAIGRGLMAGNPQLTLDLCPLVDPAQDRTGKPGGSRRGEGSDLPVGDTRLRRARAVVIATGHLDHETLLRGGGVCEIATRARQAGVPAYAIAGRDELDLFEKRILDLQVVIEAAAERSLAAVAKRLAASIL
jgi:glycerate kinase